MNPESQEVKNLLDELELTTKLDERTVETRLRSLQSETSSEQPCKEFLYELMAFAFMESSANDGSPWGTYFCPQIVLTNQDGSSIEFPCLSNVDVAAINYWRSRCNHTSNAIMKARYSGLVWDLCFKCTGDKPSHTFALSSADALLSLIENQAYLHSIDAIQKLRRAFTLGINLRNHQLIDRAKNAALCLEKRISDDSKPGLWGFCFDLIVDNKKVNKTPEEERQIIADLEERYSRLLSEGRLWPCECAAKRLGRYYRAKGMTNEMERVIRALGELSRISAISSPPLAAQQILRQAYILYKQFNITDALGQVLVELRALGADLIDSMLSHEFSVELPREELIQFAQEMAGGDLSVVLSRIAIHFLPPIRQSKQRLDEGIQQYPLVFSFPRYVCDKEGRVVSTIGPAETDYEGLLINQISQDMNIYSVSLDFVLRKAIEEHTLSPQLILDYLYASTAFPPSQQELLAAGIAKYLDGDYLSANHILTPRIEVVLRNIVEQSGGTVLKEARGGGFYLRNVDELLRSEQMLEVFGSDICLYLRVLLSDPRGWNVRNDICHGLGADACLSKSTSDRLIHVLLLLSQLRQKTV
jgi:hypothetical protein